MIWMIRHMFSRNIIQRQRQLLVLCPDGKGKFHQPTMGDLASPYQKMGRYAVQGSSVHVKSGSFVHVRSWSSVHVTLVWFCHCISVTWFFLLLFFLYVITQLITVWVFSSHLCVGFLFLGLHSAPSPPSPPPLFLLSLNFTQVLSHNANNSSHTNSLLPQLT